MRILTLIGIAVSTIVVGCETLRVTDIRDTTHRLPTVVEQKEVVSEGHDLNDEGFFAILRKACRVNGSFNLTYKGKVEKYHCYPAEDYGE